MLTLALASPHWSPCQTGRCAPVPDPADLGSFAGARFPFPPGSQVTAAERAEADLYWQRELESLQSVDRIVGDLVEELRAQGELENTYVIFESDNGLLHGEHGIFDKNVAWDRSVRVPLLIRGPGFAPGAARDDLTVNVDLTATILATAGVASPRPLDGYSLLSGHRRRMLLLERPYGFSSRLQQPWRELKTRSGWTYWRDLISGRRHLYDLNSDPWQLHNLVKAKPDVVHRLQRRLSGVAACAAPCP
jgi:arylsulfatase A-like enzyme